MIRFALMLAFLASPVTAQTEPVFDALKQCIRGAARPLEHPEQFGTAITTAAEHGWTATERHPNIYRLEKAGDDSLTIDLGLPGPDGATICMVTGPAMTPGLAEQVADQAVASGMMPPNAAPVDPLPQGHLRYHALFEGPVIYGLRAFRTRKGEVLQLDIVGYPAPPPEDQPAEVRDALTRSIELCLHPNVTPPQRAHLFRDAGYEERLATMENGTLHHFVDPAGASVKLRYRGDLYDCIASSDDIGVDQATGILDLIAPKLYPTYRRTTNLRDGAGPTCAVYKEAGNKGHAIWVSVGGGDGACVENGTVSVIAFDPS